MALASHAFPSPNDTLLELSATEQAALIRDGSLTSEALVDLYLTRIKAHDGALGAFASVLEKSARQEAERADRARKNGAGVGFFNGVPTGIKDLHFVRGSFTRMGSRAWRFLWSPFDDVTTTSVRRAGFVIVGKTSTSELGLLPIVETDIHPPTRNPWNTQHTAGGSSGGAGAAVAAGLLPLAPGSDGAGSIRIPASLCGLVGLKPSRGALPHGFKHIDVHRMATTGPIGRCVDDVAALFDSLANRNPGELGTSYASVRTPPRRLKLGLLLDPPMGETHPGIRARVLDAAQTLRALGHDVVEVAPVRVPLAEFLPVYQHFISRVPAPVESVLQPMTRWFREQGRSRPASVPKAALESLNKRTATLFEGLDGLVTPTVAVPPPKVGEFAHLPPAEMFEALAPLGAFTAAWNLNGAPALTLPWGTVDGLPAGVQLVGRRDTDDELLALGRELEQARA